MFRYSQPHGNWESQATADVVVSTTAAAANFKVTLTWKKPAADGSVPEPSSGES